MAAASGIQASRRPACRWRYRRKSAGQLRRSPVPDTPQSKAGIARGRENPSCCETRPVPKPDSQNGEKIPPVSDERRPNRQDCRRCEPPCLHVSPFQLTTGRLSSTAANSHHDSGAIPSNRGEEKPPQIRVLASTLAGASFGSRGTATSIDP